MNFIIADPDPVFLGGLDPVNLDPDPQFQILVTIFLFQVALLSASKVRIFCLVFFLYVLLCMEVFLEKNIYYNDVNITL